MPYDSNMNYRTKDKTGKKIHTKTKLRLNKLVFMLQSQREQQNSEGPGENRKTKSGFSC